ncbi:hypothetical protein [Bacillus cereus group sp. BfR-BA-01379]|uniref:hypothetical protein n=1 Tax=Bacillus cereus group sp. BfR-BA-01379 TaxID=2920323 RepID=UPI001F58398F|nr:hypothetical protein [Bacillus cereus group sp. BfR-BA-01379]
MYLYLAINFEENTIFYLGKNGKNVDVERIFKKVLHSFYISTPRVITAKGQTTDAISIRFILWNKFIILLKSVCIIKILSNDYGYIA